MSSQFLVWNAQGVTNTHVKRHLKNLIREHKILFATVIEPQRAAPAVGRNFQGLRFVGANVSGHIWILAHEDWTEEVVDDSRQVLHIKVTAAVFSFPIYISIVYGRHTRETRHELWKKLGDISLAVDGRPWLVGGDFNIFLTNEERQGSDTDKHRKMMEFADAIADCQLIDPGIDGPIFTWHRAGLRERLDMILIGEHWTSVFATTRVTHLARFSSDHAPLLVRCQFSVQRSRPTFRFQNIWVRHETFKSEIARVWEAETCYNGMMNLQLRPIRIKKFLKVWNRVVFGNIHQNLKNAEDTEESEVEDTYDRGRGQVLTEVTEIRNSVTTFFQQLLTSDVGGLDQPDLTLIHSLPDSVDQDALCSVPQEKEVRDAVFGSDVIEAVGDFFSGPFMTRSFAATMIILIPKKLNLVTWGDYRPISLCNVTNKIITKILASRLAPLLPLVIAPNQSGFIRGHLLSDKSCLLRS
ncbi:uncharacterized protein LOC121741759 [Salvia splendens]|uniref:uncharacterized protein LOC121741759 n=1 Tax=Salvia splendens TaxID=180675 RepID=UPI001C26C55C|nr:uncharacterized protein LOC121741759 [Salvia splendens]